MDIARGETGALPTVEPLPAAELRELQVFLILAEELHFGRAAERLQINRSRVSQVIKALEVKLGGRLVERTSRRVRLTPLGERLRTNLATPYQQLLRGIDDTREAAVGIAGALRIGIYSRISCGSHWHRITQSFTSRHPACQLEMIDTGFDRNYLDLLRQGTVDLLATRLPLSDPDMTVGPILSREPRVVLISKDDPLASQRSISLEDLGNRAIPYNPSLPREMIDAFFPPVTPSGRKIRRIRIASFEEGLLLVAAGRMVHPTVASYLSYYADQRVTALPITDLPVSETAVVWLTNNRSRKVHAFVSTAATVLAQTELAA